MNALVPHIFEDHLVRSILRDQEPWFVAVDVCKALGHSNPTVAVGRLDQDEVSTLNITEGTSPKGGNPTHNIVSEPGVFRLIFTSRKPEAERFKRWLAHEVLPKLRREGSYSTSAPEFEVTAETISALSLKMQMVREARMLFGQERAKSLWHSLGFPTPPTPPIGQPSDEVDARACLEHLLDAEFSDELSFRGAIEEAIGGQGAILEALRKFGVLIADEGEGFYLVRRHPAITHIFEGTAWSGSLWGHAIRRVRGAKTAKAARVGSLVARTIFLPDTVLDWTRIDNAQIQVQNPQ